MASFSSYLLPNFRPLSSVNHIDCSYLSSSLPSHSFSQLNNKTNKKKKKTELAFPAVASISIPYQQPINVDYLEQEFSGHGVIFKGIGDDICVAKMALENGSKAILMLPSGLITSYKASMWHGGTVELLQASVSDSKERQNAGVGIAIQGGVSLAFDCTVTATEDEQLSWSPTHWALHDIRGNPQQEIEVELISTDSEEMVEMRYIITLREDVLVSEFVVSNSKSSPLQLSGSILSHLTVSSPDATYAVGLERSDFLTRLPILSSFGIIPPDFGLKNESQMSKLWKKMARNGFMSGWGPKNQENGENNQVMEEGEEDDNYKHLSEQMCRIYTSAPTDFTIIDRGRRNSVIIGRDGLDELYIFSPGSSHEDYGKYSYICIGQSAVLKPVIVGPNESWRGGQRIYNPNL